LFYGDNGQLDMTRHRNNPLKLPLQAIAADILGLEHTEIKPRITHPTAEVDGKQVTIAIHSTAQAKYWNNPFGWQEVVNWLISKGYTVKLLSNEGLDYMENRAPTGVVLHPSSSIEDVMVELKKSTMFIGVSSGLSWLSWALDVPTVVISGFTDAMNEMTDCIRITAPEGKCSGCWHRHKFNPGDWNWCPEHKGTPRQFECSREITADMVIRELEKVL
jgi:autotransporter strand-loop-strand O-heptosyltransferase